MRLFEQIRDAFFVRKRRRTRRIVFTHIGKTGGNTVNFLLRQVRANYGLNMLFLAGATTTFAAPSAISHLLASSPYRTDDFDIITGHIPFASARMIFDNSSYIAVLRDPRWQLISNFCSQPDHRSRPDFGATEFISLVTANSTAEWAMDNQQTRMLCNSTNISEPLTEKMLQSAKKNLMLHYSAVGISDEMDAFFASTSQLCGLRSAPAAPIKNATGPYKNHITEDILNFSAQRNSFDMRLFKWAKENLHSFGRDDLAFSQKGPGRLVVVGHRLFEIEDTPAEQEVLSTSYD